MNQEALKDALEARINAAAQSIIDKKSTSDDIALGKLDFLSSLRRLLDGKATPHDLGRHDALNDVLQDLGVLSSKETYLSRLDGQ
ncbi:hypothetical protein M2D63_013270 [Pseudomonas sp. BJa5]|uniref:hypothetical protein n=1 Tax=Pseudomonas sp. BJa5 TaxID=2936270 RepID=UPI00255A245E|nr:hypothetical protein [Pseudomonas sp. BGr12]MDL2422085.1 hypothetical protein [Pseudomonas sp. BGr12]